MLLPIMSAGHEVRMIPVNQPLLDGTEGKYLAECLETGWISSAGPFVGQFEAIPSHRRDLAPQNMLYKHHVAVTCWLS